MAGALVLGGAAFALGADAMVAAFLGLGLAAIGVAVVYAFPDRLPGVEPAPAIELGELSARIGMRKTGVAGASGNEPPSAWYSELYDLRLFAALGVPRFQATHSAGGKCAVAVMSIEAVTRLDGPRTVARFPVDQLARAIRQNIRGSDIAARYADNEFVLLLDRCDRSEAQRIVGRLSKSVAEIASPAGPLALSAGVAMSPDSAADLHGLIERADALLREIRLGGRSEVRLLVPDWAKGLTSKSSVA